MARDDDIENLLLMSGEVFPMDNGFWTKIEAWRIEPNDHVPHGIRYSLTLHNRQNQRVLGFDNAHGVKAGKRFQARRIAWDHRHQLVEVAPYEFKSAAQLLDDFWNAVDGVISAPRGR
ncbi:MAG: DUF6516 family protein [Moraxellaceae bacterium]|nr:DUF6516 family protein [Moraxellaceae bacterium]